MFNAVEQQGQQTCSHTDEHAEHNGRRSEPTKAFDSNRWLHVNLRTLCNEYALGTPPQSRYARQLPSKRGAKEIVLLPEYEEPGTVKHDSGLKQSR